ncbi:hypothetical protein QBC38DRAFT_504651 [Podospora fimiseda]|uniref:Uncharacterized protein n=1 Tax=Podospora fimiseda TaxID=252190 RepID=A0AAN6YRZ6_9PEZI|nr:hypothetical protein QBC38DRAFT_504651 [Podospora fimiseda]
MERLYDLSSIKSLPPSLTNLLPNPFIHDSTSHLLPHSAHQSHQNNPDSPSTLTLSDQYQQQTTNLGTSPSLKPTNMPLNSLNNIRFPEGASETTAPDNLWPNFPSIDIQTTDYNPGLSYTDQAQPLVNACIRQGISHGQLWQEASEKALAAPAGSDKEGFYEAIKGHLCNVDHNNRPAPSVQVPFLVRSLVSRGISHGAIYCEAHTKWFRAPAGSEEERPFNAIKLHLKNVVSGACLQGVFDGDEER